MLESRKDMAHECRGHKQRANKGGNMETIITLMDQLYPGKDYCVACYPGNAMTQASARLIMEANQRIVYSLKEAGIDPAAVGYKKSSYSLAGSEMWSISCVTAGELLKRISTALESAKTQTPGLQ